MLERFVDIRPGEWRRLAPLVMAYALVLASVYVLKPARNALFLDRMGIAQLPYVLILVALIGGASAIAYARLTRSVRIQPLLIGTFSVLAVQLMVFRWLFAFEASWVYYLFYVWVNLFGLMAVSLLWLLANAIFDAREARRLFGLIGSGGIAGAILGGSFTGWAVDFLGTENLTLVCAGLLLICLVLVWCIPGSESVPAEDEAEASTALQAVLASPMLRQMAAMAGVVAIVAAIADVQFNQIADAVFPSKDSKTAFFGAFFAWLNGFAFLFQLVITPFVLRRFGVSGALMFLPVSMGLGAFCVLLIPGLLGGVAVKVGDVGFRHAIHKSAVEVLYLPVPQALKKRTKVFLDTTVDNLATGLGAALVLLLTGVLGVSYQHLSVLSLGFVAVWGWILYRLRGSYIDAFRQALDQREINPDDFRVQLSDRSVINSLLVALRSRNTRQVVYALEMLGTVGDQNLTEEIRPLLAHDDDSVRYHALRVLQQGRSPHLVDEVAPLLSDRSAEVCLEAMHFLRLHDQDLSRLRAFLSDSAGRVQSAALGYIARYGSPEEKRLLDANLVRSAMRSDDADSAFVRAQLARALSLLDNPELQPFIDILKTDDDPMVVREIMHSLGEIGDLAHAPWLISQLGMRTYRVEARLALAKFGEGVLPLLVSVLDDDETPLGVRRAIPRVLGEIAVQASVDALLQRLDRVPAAMGYLLVKGLSKLRLAGSHLTFPADRVDGALMLEAQSYFDLLQIRRLLQTASPDRSHSLLLSALTESIQLTLERMFRLLGLQYQPRDMYHAYLGVTSAEKTPRANALEFLDNVLDRHQKTYVLLFLDADSEEVALAHGRRLFGGALRTRIDGLRYLLDGGDLWLKACALNCVRPDDGPALVSRVHDNTQDQHTLIQETAELAARRLAAA